MRFEIVYKSTMLVQTGNMWFVLHSILGAGHLSYTDLVDFIFTIINMHKVSRIKKAGKIACF